MILTTELKAKLLRRVYYEIILTTELKVKTTQASLLRKAYFGKSNDGRYDDMPNE